MSSPPPTAAAPKTDLVGSTRVIATQTAAENATQAAIERLRSRARKRQRPLELGPIDRSQGGK